MLKTNSGQVWLAEGLLLRLMRLIRGLMTGRLMTVSVPNFVEQCTDQTQVDHFYGPGLIVGIVE